MCTGMWRAGLEVSLVDDSVQRECYGDVVLFFGNRHRDGDFLYAGDLAAYVDNKTLTHLFTAFSRDQVRCSLCVMC